LREYTVVADEGYMRELQYRIKERSTLLFGYDGIAHMSVESGECGDTLVAVGLPH